MNFDSQEIEGLVQNVKAGNHEKFNDLLKIYKPWINRNVRRTNRNLLNAHHEDLIATAQTALFQAIIRYDNRKHKSAFHYLGNFIWDELRQHARSDSDSAFPGFQLSKKQENEDGEYLDPGEHSENGIYEDSDLDPEEFAIRREFWEHIIEYRKSLQELGKRRRSALSKLKVLEDILRHPGDSIRDIANRTSLSKSVITDYKRKIFEELKEIFRTFNS